MSEIYRSNSSIHCSREDAAILLEACLPRFLIPLTLMVHNIITNVSWPNHQKAIDDCNYKYNHISPHYWLL